MSRAQISKHYTRILAKWPIDRLRPEVAFQNVLRKRIAAAPVAESSAQNTAQAEIPTSTRHGPADELSEINALYSLLDNRYSKEYPVSQAIMRPQSNPDHYKQLEKELDEAPDRSWWTNFVKRMTNMVRLK